MINNDWNVQEKIIQVGQTNMRILTSSGQNHMPFINLNAEIIGILIVKFIGKNFLMNSQMWDKNVWMELSKSNMNIL